MNFLKNFLLFVVSLVVVLVLAEFVVRFSLNDITSTSNMQSWFGTRWKNEFVVKNSYGFREKEVAPEKPADVYRIVMLGDSFGFGQGIPAEDRFSNLIGAALNESGKNVEMLNFSFPGATSMDQHKILEDKVLPLSPDFVLIQWLPNDFEDQQERWKTKTKPLIPNDRWHRELQKTSALYFLINNQWIQIRQAIWGPEASYQDQLLEPFSEPGSEAYRTAVQPMIDFLATLNETGIDYALVLHPMLQPNLVGDYPMAQLHELTLSMCRDADATCLDLSPVFQELGPDFDMTSLWVNRFDPHPSSEANRMVADYILAELAPAAWGYKP